MSKFLSRGSNLLTRMVNKSMWRLPPEEFLAVYNKHMLNSRNHLEIGSSSIYYTISSNAQDRLNMHVTLLGPDEYALQLAKDELVTGGFHPSMIRLIECEYTEITASTIPKPKKKAVKPFDTIALNLVLQDIALPIVDKFPRILDGLSSYMDKNTSFWGSTITNIPDDAHTTFAKNYMRVLQNANYINNSNDSLKETEQIMDAYFENYTVKEIGYGITFEGTNFKPRSMAKDADVGEVEAVQTSKQPEKAVRLEKFI
mmetsp:Transcript_9141/g.14869  ORF Transcript_9141/g.14869 Transcript_9141/m.14869 type:complete len:257 (-) Transcript_9141:141-911(-)|eukprot:CAMPEP_0197022080 /NCGR_PEP_ID=MMETSP1384-20130603/2988_1 /TAXON_ID=29189 /ORGANISM="Ammonia sp." /LENGTH=256 /DNA_ID=CAMNT_0042450047 /DNA_START=39 /DNA_END=809 /DNA_ORIENTATION=+